MFTFPNSSAMDATAGSGGPITFLPRIVTGQPEQVAAHVAHVLDKAKQFVTLMDDFAKAEKQLSQVWSGAASETALKKITDSLQSFEKIIKVVQEGAQLLGVAGTLVKTAQTAYTSVVSAVNPTVAALMSNPWTHAAAVALSTATSASLRGFIEAIGGLLKTLGLTKLGTELTTLASIVQELEKLFGGSNSASASTPAGTTPSTTTVTSNPVTAPVTPPPVASPTGQQVTSTPTVSQPNPYNYTPPALGGTGTTAPSTADSWIPVDPPAGTTPSTGTVTTPPATTPPSTTAPPATTTPASDPGVIKVTTTIGSESTTVEIPTGHDAQVDVDIPVNGEHVTEHISVTGTGKVSVS
ncbi:WXG100 family type VII secretion target [Kutzneria sp. 744]|uniref:WXG100 family type VII secretion target n=1 Tax=Kutzneria sp. (strain 744) TaxID=345341 RepID=UPI0003EEC7C8|nr:WXG100 family type VII secretion target [Kutzneria sp. 744]EWM17068.1 mucin-2 [Kutzneria sp. 744]